MTNPAGRSVDTILTLFSLTCFMLPSAFAYTEKVQGQAFNLKGELEYVEEHLVTYKDGKIVAVETNFYDADTRRIAKQVSEFSQRAQFGSYDFFDERRQYNDGVRVLQERILIYRRKNPGAELKQKYISRKPGQIVGQGLYQFVAANMDALARGHSLTAALVLPAPMGQFDVRISKKKIQGDCIHLSAELENWFLRMFCPDVEVEYDMNKRRLVRYRGASMVMNKNSENVPVVTTYHYSDHPSFLEFKTSRQARSPLNWPIGLSYAS